jgi:hypothetical protein
MTQTVKKRKPSGKGPRNKQQPRCAGCRRFIPARSEICPHCRAEIVDDDNATFEKGAEKKSRKAEGAKENERREPDAERRKRPADKPAPGKRDDPAPVDAPAAAGNFFDW